MRRYSLAFLTGASFLAVFAACAHSRRVIAGHDLRSSANPRAGIRIAAEYKYLGRVAFALGPDFEGERFIFGDSTDKTLTRLVIVQFEKVKADSAERYRYDMTNAEPIGSLSFLHNEFAFSPDKHVNPAPKDEGEVTNNFLLARGYVLPNVWLASRFVTLGSPDRRSEMIVFYLEGTNELALSDLYRNDEATPEWTELKPRLRARARDAFSVN